MQRLWGHNPDVDAAYRDRLKEWELAFKERLKTRQQIEFVSFIDMVFILLVFFMVTSFSIKNPLEEISFSVPVPEYSPGRAQILIQLIDDRNVFWMDESASQIVAEVEQTLGYLSDERQRDRILEELFSRDVIGYGALRDKIENLKGRAFSNPSERYFVMIRCPNHLPYIHVIKVITFLSNTTFRNIKYGCVGGTLDEIKSCRRIHTLIEKRPDGTMRKNIVIDFAGQIR